VEVTGEFAAHSARCFTGNPGCGRPFERKRGGKHDPDCHTARMLLVQMLTGFLETPDKTPNRKRAG
jgi:hypothetical protein